MPEEKQLQAIEEEKLSIPGIQNLNFHNSQVLAYLSVRTENGTNIVIIMNGDRLRSSVIVFDNDMRRKLLPNLDNVRISKVANTKWEGHLFAINEENSLIAINLKYLCSGCTPYLVSRLNDRERGSTLSVEKQNILIAQSSGEVYKILVSPFIGTVHLE